MCPDKKLLSAYFDNEIEPKWSIQIKKHIDNCISCQSQISKWNEISSFLIDNDTALSNKIQTEISQKKIWKNIENYIFHNPKKNKKIISFPYKNFFIPLTVAASLIFLMVISFNLKQFFYNNSSDLVATGKTAILEKNNGQTSKSNPSLSLKTPYIPELSITSSSINPVKNSNLRDNEAKEIISKLYNEINKNDNLNIYFNVPTEYDFFIDGSPDFKIIDRRALK